MYQTYFKRAIDVLFSFFFLLLLSPVFLLLTLLLFLFNGGNIFFTQSRPGRNEKMFNILKFKTMNDKVDQSGNLLPDSQRLTTMGTIIRKTSLDEIPQLINVLKGDMSLVGPRPLLHKYLPYYTEEEKLRHSVRPGITGLAQINGRNFLGWEDRLRFDIYYVKNLSFFLDCEIIYKTIFNVLSSKGIVVDPGSVMLDFDEQRKLETKKLNISS
jgi:undecaprenyl phosphate N,N'-diacetylbacillosamine 1-phosphate transferase